MKRIINTFFDKHQNIRFFLKNMIGKGLVENYFKTSFEKNCLIMYMVAPFLTGKVSNSHQAYWQEIEIARNLLARGYNIDVIDYNNTSARLKKKYDLIIDLIPGKNHVFRKHMNPGCKTIAYLTGSNATFQNAAEKKRLSDLKVRRGVELAPRRQSPYLTKDIETYTACFMIGNEYNWKTYDEFKLDKPFFIRNTGHTQKYVYNKSLKKKNCFLYFGSTGQVHKGLDLLLEIFSENDFNYELYVCGSFENEKDFTKEYYSELYEKNNIHPVGFVNIEGCEFEELISKCVFSILPSCSEANAGAVLTTMSAGLIPICSYECGFEDDEVIHLKDCRKDTIKKTIIECSNMDEEWLEKESRRVYDIVQSRYSKKNFVDSINYAFDSVLNEK